jgi:hypothetical protein
MDIIFLAATAALVALLIGLVKLCDRLANPGEGA